jgi:superfamily II DNA or RNA helicase
LTYFADNYLNFRWFLAEGQSPGLRLPQLGAIHAVAAHFASRSEPAIVTMPTGSGKTAVLMAVPFVQRASRALVITPSRLVRGQIVEDFRKLKILKNTTAIPEAVMPPEVREISSRIKSLADWQDLAKADVVVGTPNSLSPEYSEIPDPPEDLFDIVLVDEAHHSPARTWEALLGRFPKAQRILFTATPFRLDKGHIIGRFVFTYELRAALRDGVFGTLDYEPINPKKGDFDLAIARAASSRLRSDQKAGLDHRIMVRSGTISRAQALLSLYQNETDLKLQLVTGNHSVRTLNHAVGALQSGELDGIVCVDMFGEGFDLPNLKVAALHSPHRSLAVTLQFIGRFARTTGPNLGSAVFFALASEMEIERQRLYNEGAAWEELIPSLSADRIAREQETREVVETFVADADAADTPSPEDISLHALTPQFHVKIFEASEEIDITVDIDWPDAVNIEKRWVSNESNSVIYITRSTTRPKWTTSEMFDGIQYDLTILFHDKKNRLVFVGATTRSPRFYADLADSLIFPDPEGDAVGVLRPVPFSRLNKVLLDIESPRFFNVGMRQTGGASASESYKIVTGARADGSIQASDARAYARGHLAGAGTEGGVEVTIGLSGGSKVWSTSTGQLADFLRWCHTLGSKLRDKRDPKTFSGVDFLKTGVEVEKLPSELAFADWPPDTYLNSSLRVRCQHKDGTEAIVPLLEVRIGIDVDRTDTASALLTFDSPAGRHEATFSYNTSRLVEADPSSPVTIVFVGDYQSDTIEDYLNEHFPVLRTIGFGRLDGFDYLGPSSVVDPFDSTRCDVIDWKKEGVDIQLEYDASNPRSIHAYLERRLSDSSAEVVFYDHGTGEIADFLELRKDDSGVLGTLYHVKSSAQPKAGQRLADAYEVCGQTIKSSHWTDRKRLLDAVTSRFNRNTGQSRFVRGTLNDVTKLLTPSEQVPSFALDAVVVQPGFSASALGGRIAALLAAADDYLRSGGCGRLRVFCSK